LQNFVTMKILVTAATPGEMSVIEPALTFSGGQEGQFAVTGVGAMHTLFNLMQLIREERPSLIVQAGIAGSFTRTIGTGSAVAITSEIPADLGVWEETGYQDIFDMGLCGPDIPPYSKKQLVNPHNDLLQSCGMPCVAAVTVNRITTQASDIELFHHRYGAAIESMEGAALHYICLLENIPFIQIRGISNLVGERDKSQWQIKSALTRASQTIQTLLLNLNPQP
jgi:futalosine hydrolase